MLLVKILVVSGVLVVVALMALVINPPEALVKKVFLGRSKRK